MLHIHALSTSYPSGSLVCPVVRERLAVQVCSPHPRSRQYTDFVKSDLAAPPASQTPLPLLLPKRLGLNTERQPARGSRCGLAVMSSLLHWCSAPRMLISLSMPSLSFLCLTRLQLVFFHSPSSWIPQCSLPPTPRGKDSALQFAAGPWLVYVVRGFTFLRCRSLPGTSRTLIPSLTQG